MIDYHVHTAHSIDAEGTVREYCEQAVRRGLKEICITNHCELDPLRNDSFIRFNNKREPFTRDNLLRLQNEVLREKIFFKESGLDVKFGIEVGYYDGIESRLEQVTEGINFDFLLGSIHCLDHICIDSSKECSLYFSIHTVSELLENYFQAVEHLISSKLCDAVGHLDVYKKYGLAFYGEKINSLQEDSLKRTFLLMEENDVALEINTAGLRRIKEYYPSPSLLQYAQSEGVSRITIGSDAHRVDDLGKGINQGLEYAKSSGFNVVYGFEKRRPIPIKI
jgi:histidinol-phosphatase (PHP family)